MLGDEELKEKIEEYADSFESLPLPVQFAVLQVNFDHLSEGLLAISKGIEMLIDLYATHTPREDSND